MKTQIDLGKQNSFFCIEVVLILNQVNKKTQKISLPQPFFIVSDLCTTKEGQLHTAKQRSILKLVLKYLFAEDPLSLEQLLCLEDEFLKMDSLDTVQWKIFWNLYRPLVKDNTIPPGSGVHELYGTS